MTRHALIEDLIEAQLLDLADRANALLDAPMSPWEAFEAEARAALDGAAPDAPSDAIH